MQRPRRPYLQSHEVFLLILTCVGVLYEGAGRRHWSSLSFTHDHVVHVVGAQELLNGRGISAATVDPSDFASFAYRPIVEWPPAYSATLSAFLSAFGDVVDAVLALDLLLIVVCFGSWLWLIYQTRGWLSYRLRIFLCAWWVVVASPAWNLGHSDLYSLAFFILSTALTVGTVRRRSIVFAAATGFHPILPAGSRYGSTVRLRQ